MATMRDVAEHAGVSVTTVSHYINKTRRVSDELQMRISAAMEALNYQPNALARSLRRKITHSLGIIIPDSANPFFAEVARGIEDASFEQDYNVFLCNTDGNPKKELIYANVLVEKQVDGILFVASAGTAHDLMRTLAQRKIPLVLVDRDLPDVEADSVLVNNRLGGYQATRHLIDLGHRRIGCIAGPSALTPSAERVTGYRQALAECSIPIDESLIVKGSFHYQSGFEAAQKLLSLPEPPTAIFACNDLMAVGAISAAIKSGRSVPGQLSVVGFDDIQLASYVNPPLTTVAQPTYDVGMLAAKLLMERLQDRDLPPRRQYLETQLVIRESTAAVGVPA